MSVLRLRPAELADWLMGRGQHFATTDEVAGLLGVEPSQVRNSLRRQREANKIISVSKGAWVPVPPEYRVGGAPSPANYIDPLMNHLGHPYYVGLLSAAQKHGASHQSPMVFQVVTPAALRDRTIGGCRIQFIRRAETASRPTERCNVPTGRINISTPEVTVLDLTSAPRRGAGLSNVATIIGDLLYDEILDLDLLAEVAATYPLAIAQRLGYLIDFMSTEIDNTVDLGRLAELVKGADYVPLEAHRPVNGDRLARWRVVLNTEVEHDL